METRLNIQISSLNENLAAARTEAEKFQQETREAGEKLADAEKRNDDLQGEIAGKVFCDKVFLGVSLLESCDILRINHFF